MTDDVLTMEELLGCTKTRLAQTVRAQANLLVLLQRELAVEQWQSGLLASQRQAIFDLLYGEKVCHPCPEDALCQWCRLEGMIYGIIITDPRDEIPKEGTYGPDGWAEQASATGEGAAPPAA